MTNVSVESRPRPRPEERAPDDDSGPVGRTQPGLSSPLSAGVLILAVLAPLAALFFAKHAVLPIALAIALKLLLQPILDFLCNRLRLPTALGVLILTCGLFAAIGAVAFSIARPASGW